jgi:hypothetical protein
MAENSIHSVRFTPGSRLKSISSQGFQHCRRLASISIPASVEEIGALAFEGCSGLAEVIFATDGRLREMSGFHRCMSLSRVEIPASVEAIYFLGFYKCAGLMEMIFATGNRLRKIEGFGECTSLSRIEIPGSVEKICGLGFAGCTGLVEVIFATNGCLKQICGFRRCRSLSRLRIRASVQIGGSLKDPCFDENEFRGDPSRRELIFGSGTHLRPHAKKDRFLGFVVFEDANDLKRRRRQVHL